MRSKEAPARTAKALRFRLEARKGGARREEKGKAHVPAGESSKRRQGERIQECRALAGRISMGREAGGVKHSGRTFISWLATGERQKIAREAREDMER